MAVAVIVKTFIVQPFYIPSESMEHTLYGCQGCNGDKILVNKPIFDFRSPEPGDIIVFSRPDAWPTDSETPVAPKTNIITGPIRWFGQLVGVVPPDREDLVKRVIAVGGQTIKCCDAQGRVQVSNDGPSGTFRSLDEPYVDFTNADGASTGTEMTFGPVTVPHGRLWVMGDHRVDSADSRYHCVAGANNAPRRARSATRFEHGAHLARDRQGVRDRLAAVALAHPRHPGDVQGRGPVHTHRRGRHRGRPHPRRPSTDRRRDRRPAPLVLATPTPAPGHPATDHPATDQLAVTGAP